MRIKTAKTWVCKLRLLFGISLFWLALSVLSDGMSTLLLPERVLILGESDQQATVLGLLSFAGLLAGTLVQPVAGTWSDLTMPRWGRRGILLIGSSATMMALLVFGFSQGFSGVALGYVLVQLCTGIIQAAQQGFIPDQVPPADRGLASGMKSMMDIGGATLGFVFIGQLLSAGMFTEIIYICVSLILAALLLTKILVKEKPPEATGSPITWPGWNPFRLDMRYHKRFVWLVVSRFFFLLGTYAVGRFLLLFVAERLNLPPGVAAQQSGQLLAGLAFITFLVAPAAGWAADRFGRLPLMLFGAIVSGIGVLAYIFAVSLGQLVFFGGLLSLGSAAFISANWAMTADVVPKSEAARYFGLANVGTGGAAAAAGLFGLLVDGVNRSIPGAGFTALFIAAAAAFLATSLSLMKLRQTSQPPPSA